MNSLCFENPGSQYRMKAILHQWPGEEEVLMDAIRDFGYGGVATNPSQGDGYTTNPENLAKFDRTLKKLQEKGLAYWIYDENGYPSGYGGGYALEGHPELEAKGFYMVRRLAVEPKHSAFHLDDESDRIIWAAKYPVDHSVMNASVVEYEKMEAVPFTDTFCECDLKENEVFFVFCVKSAYEGSHLTHNVCSRSRYINILDKNAVRRFLDVCYEPIVEASPDAYCNACAVFTDEPSLVTAYIQGDEVWPYALAPWKEGLFEDFEKEYGYSILPYLPQIFEGRDSSYTTRVHFYQLIGKLSAEAYAGQISRWCHEYGGRFSGHYLAEESLRFHVLYYGSYLEMLKATDYPGVDVLAAYPKIYHPNTTRFAQMAARKKGTNGLMAELCPFIDIPYFEKDPVRYATGILNLLYLGGVRCVNSYFSSDFASYAPDILEAYSGYMSREQARWVNNYVGRLGYVLDGAQSECGTFVYYALEDVQAKTRPTHCAQESSDCDTDRSLLSLTKRMMEEGIDYQFADREDIVNAAKEALSGDAEISGMKVETVILPAMDVIWPDAWEALKLLKSHGVNIWFADKIPASRVGDRVRFAWYDFREESVRGPKCTEAEGFRAMTEEEILRRLAGQEQELALEVTAAIPAVGGIAFAAGGGDVNGMVPAMDSENANGMIPASNVRNADGMLLKSKYRKEGKALYFVVNNSEKDVEVAWNLKGKEQVEVWDPADGSVATLGENEMLRLGSYRGKFLVVA